MIQPTLADVARAAGVHPGTASKALNPATGNQVSDETRSRVLAAAQRLGYRPNALARGLRTRRSHTVGVLLPDLTNPLFPPIVRGAESVLEPAGYHVLVANTDNDPARVAQFVATMRASQVDGFIFATARRDDPLLAELARAGIPAVLVNRWTDDRLLPAVGGDDAGGVRAAIDLLVGLGHRRIAQVAGPLSLSTGHLRHQAYREALDAHGLPFDPALTVEAEAYSEPAGVKAFGQLHDRATGGFTAVLAGNDLLALGCYTAAETHGLDIPADLSVVGYNDMPLADRLTPSLTTVRLPQYEIGATAAQLLLERLENPEVPIKRVLLPTPLQVRASTAPPRPLPPPPPPAI